MKNKTGKAQDAAVAAGLCYFCLEREATHQDGLGGKACQPCLEDARQVMIKHALSQPGYSRRKRNH